MRKCIRLAFLFLVSSKLPAHPLHIPIRILRRSPRRPLTPKQHLHPDSYSSCGTYRKRTVNLYASLDTKNIEGSVRTNSTHSGRRRRRPHCFYKSRRTGQWTDRLELNDLRLGQELVDCHVVQELLDGKTGPKVFCDCGVGRFQTKNGKWKIVHAMLRLDRKESAARKRATRLRKKASFPAYVSRIRLDNDRLEVCLAPGDVKASTERKISASQLLPGQELIGTVVRIEPYGVFVDVGANRKGLLHIQKVADLYGTYIDKSEGLVNAGLERGFRIRVKVASNERQRLFLDFTDDVKEEAAKELAAKWQPPKTRSMELTSEASPMAQPQTKSVEPASPVSSEVSLHVQQTSISDYDEEEEDDDDYDEYDEDRDIEDALGLGTY